MIEPIYSLDLVRLSRLMCHTEVSWEPCICSTKPMSKTSGRLTTQSFVRCSSACDRTLLSEDARAPRSCPRAVCTSAGSCDMVRVSIGSHSRVVFGETRVLLQGLNEYSLPKFVCRTDLGGKIDYGYMKKRVGTSCM
jgi:hypothetical protein